MLLKRHFRSSVVHRYNSLLELGHPWRGDEVMSKSEVGMTNPAVNSGDFTAIGIEKNNYTEYPHNKPKGQIYVVY